MLQNLFSSLPPNSLDNPFLSFQLKAIQKIATQEFSLNNAFFSLDEVSGQQKIKENTGN